MRTRAIVVLVLLVAGGCRRDDETATEDTSTTTVQPASTATVPPSTASPSPPPTAAPSTEPAPSSVAPSTTIVDVPETGIPGLDSDDAFCAAWSRFGGTWQVLLVGSTFLDDPERVAEWEIASAQVVADSYADLLEFLPNELGSEADALAEGYFGVLGRRSAAAAESLAATGAPDDVGRRLGEAWLAALAGRDPSTPDLPLVVPDDLRQRVDGAVADFRAQRVEFHLDPSMVVVVETPLTDDYLDTQCPDQGTLAGGEITGG